MPIPSKRSVYGPGPRLRRWSPPRNLRYPNAPRTGRLASSPRFPASGLVRAERSYRSITPHPHIGRKRALIVNCYADETRRPVARTGKIPQTIGPQFLAGGFNPAHWDLRLYNEHSHGPLLDEELLGWPDVLVLTGLITSLDRMRHLTAYARSRNRKVLVVGGGHVVRAFPQFCRTFLDYACLGDVEDIQEVILEAFGPTYVAEEFVPRLDLGDWIGPTVGYLESTRYCNFKCSFCTLTGEGRSYKAVGADDLRKQFDRLGKKRISIFLDNNFWGGNQRSFSERIQIAGEMVRSGRMTGWGGLVTTDFFFNEGNVRSAVEAGCITLFTGVESFDTDWNLQHNKKQNGVRPQVETIRGALEAGIVFMYGLMIDLTSRSIASIREEIEVILGRPEITLPTYLSMPIPIPVTPYFYECLDGDLILPGTKVRDLDATTLCMRTMDPQSEAVDFMSGLTTLRGYRTRVALHSAKFAKRYRMHFTKDQMLIGLSGGALIASPLMATLPTRIGRRRAPRTFVSTTEPLDYFYDPAFRIDSRYESYFEPTMLTDREGRVSAALAADVEAGRPRVTVAGA